MKITFLKMQCDSDFEEEDDIEHQLAAKRERTTARQEPAPGRTEGSSRGDASFSRNWGRLQ